MSGNLRADAVGLALSGGILSLKGLGLTSPNCLCGGLYSIPDQNWPCYWDCTFSSSQACVILDPAAPGFPGASLKIPAISVSFRLYQTSPLGASPCSYQTTYQCVVQTTNYDSDSTCTTPSAGSAYVYVTVGIGIIKETGGTCKLNIGATLSGSPNGFIISPIVSFYGIFPGLNCFTFPVTKSLPIFGSTFGFNLTDPGFNPSVILSPSTSTPTTPCPAQILYSGCPGGFPPPQPTPPINLSPIYPSCPNSGTCDDTQAQLCVKAATAGLVLSDGVTPVSSDITVTIFNQRSCAAGQYPPTWGGSVSNALARVAFTGIFGDSNNNNGVGNFIVIIYDGTNGVPIWAGCLNTLTGNYSLITAFMPALAVNLGISTVAVSAGPCAPCFTFICPGIPPLATSYTLTIADGSVVGAKVSDTGTSPCDGITPYFFSQTTVSWSAVPPFTISANSAPCQWVEATSNSVNITRQFYDVLGNPLPCTQNLMQEPSWAIGLNTSTGLFELDWAIYGLYPGLPAGTTGVVGGTTIYSTGCHNGTPVGSYLDGSSVS